LHEPPPIESRYFVYRRITPRLHSAAAARMASDDGSGAGSIVSKPDAAKFKAGVNTSVLGARCRYRAGGRLGRSSLGGSAAQPACDLAKGFLLRAQNRVEAAIPEHEMAIAGDRNWLLAIATLSWCKFLTGEIEDTIPHHERALRLSPRDNLIGVWYQRIGMVHLLMHPQPHPRLAAAYALKGDIERAPAELAEARRQASDNRYSSIARLKAEGGYFRVSNIRSVLCSRPPFSPGCARPAWLRNDPLQGLSMTSLIPGYFPVRALNREFHRGSQG
jgi:tetratricopeptide (TPR) repeat protein